MKQNKKSVFIKIVSYIGVFAIAFLFASLPFIKQYYYDDNTAGAYVDSYDYSYKSNFTGVYLPNFGTFDFSYTNSNGNISTVSNLQNYDGNFFASLSTYPGSCSITIHNDLFNIPSSELSYFRDWGLVFNDINDLNLTLINLYNYYAGLSNFRIYMVINMCDSNANIDASSLSFTISDSNSSSFINNLENYSDIFYFYSSGSGVNISYKPSIVVDIIALASTFEKTVAEFLSDSVITFNTNLTSVSSLRPFVSFVASYIPNDGSSAPYLLTQYISSSDSSACLFKDIGLACLYDYYYFNGNYDFSLYYDNLYADKLAKAYDNGYSAGILVDSDSLVPNTILAFASYPFTLLGGFLNFNLFGFNIYNILLAFITTLLIIWLIKKIK